MDVSDKFDQTADAFTQFDATADIENFISGHADKAKNLRKSGLDEFVEYEKWKREHLDICSLIEVHGTEDDIRAIDNLLDVIVPRRNASPKKIDMRIKEAIQLSFEKEDGRTLFYSRLMKRSRYCALTDVGYSHLNELMLSMLN